MIHIAATCRARVATHPVTTCMELESDLRARCAFDRLVMACAPMAVPWDVVANIMRAVVGHRFARTVPTIARLVVK